jgi:hypothetical protein
MQVAGTRGGNWWHWRDKSPLLAFPRVSLIAGPVVRYFNSIFVRQYPTAGFFHL